MSGGTVRSHWCRAASAQAPAARRCLEGRGTPRSGGGGVFGAIEEERDADVTRPRRGFRHPPGMSARLVVQTGCDVPRRGRRILQPPLSETLWAEGALAYELDGEGQTHGLAL